MIYELDNHQFHRCRDLVNRGVNIEEKAIVEGTNPGRIFVDHIEKPRSGLIWQENHDGFIFVGDSRNEAFNQDVKRYVDEVITFEAKAQGLNWFECIGNHPSWYTAFHDIFHAKKLDSWDQNVYMICPDTFNAIGKERHQDDEFTVAQLTKEFLHQGTIENVAFAITKILDCWESEERFFEQGMGYCIVHNQSIVSICMSGYRYKDVHGIAIETLPSYRGRKLAYKAASYFVDHCFARGYRPYWDCMEDNHPSNAVARNLGFVKEFGYKGYMFKL